MKSLVDLTCTKLSRVALLPLLLASATIYGQESALLDEEKAVTPQSAAAHREAQRSAKWNVRVDLQIVSIPQGLALPLLPDLQSADTKVSEPAVAKIQVLLVEKRATLVGWPMLVTLENERGAVESEAEIRYPSDFSPPSEATFGVGRGEGPNVRENPLIPNAFETRNIGTSLEARASVLQDGKRLLVTVAGGKTVLAEMKKYESAKNRDGISTVEYQPEIGNTEVNCTVSILNGQRMLIGTHKLEKPEGQMELFILHATASRVE